MHMEAHGHVHHQISIHAPTRGATSTGEVIKYYNGYFNPRTHEGCDLIKDGYIEIDEEISIHAPTRGAT